MNNGGDTCVNDISGNWFSDRWNLDSDFLFFFFFGEPRLHQNRVIFSIIILKRFFFFHIDFACVIILAIQCSTPSWGNSSWSGCRDMLLDTPVWADVIKTTEDGPLELNVPNSESKHTGSRVGGGGCFLTVPSWCCRCGAPIFENSWDCSLISWRIGFRSLQCFHVTGKTR